MQKIKSFILIFLCCSLGLSACSSKPKLLPNDHLLAAGKEQTEKDVEECLSLADTYASDASQWQQTVGNTAKGGIIGAGAGAVGGAIVHSAGQGTAIGAASGAVAALLSELWNLGDSDPTYKEFANYCLKKRGYEVAGWR